MQTTTDQNIVRFPADMVQVQHLNRPQACPSRRHVSLLGFFGSMWCLPDHDAAVRTENSEKIVLKFPLTCVASIIFRAFQGIAGSGAYSLPSIAFFQLVPPEKYNKINAVSSIIMASAIAISPLLGGGISQENAWRWIFYLK